MGCAQEEWSGSAKVPQKNQKRGAARRGLGVEIAASSTHLLPQLIGESSHEGTRARLKDTDSSSIATSGPNLFAKVMRRRGWLRSITVLNGNRHTALETSHTNERARVRIKKRRRRRGLNEAMNTGRKEAETNQAYNERNL